MRTSAARLKFKTWKPTEIELKKLLEATSKEQRAAPDRLFNSPSRIDRVARQTPQWQLAPNILLKSRKTTETMCRNFECDIGHW